MKKNKIYWIVGFVVIIIVIILSVYLGTSKKDFFHQETTMEDIRKRGTLTALVNYNSTDYFLYKGEPMGFQLELLQNLAEELNLGLRIIPSNDIDTSLQQIHNTQIDLIASNVHITDVREEQICFTQPLFQTRQILIQRTNSSDKLIKSFGDLAGDTIYVPKGSIYESHLKHMRDLSESDFAIIALEGINEEQFVDWVASKNIDYTVVSENVATASKRYFNNIDGSFKLSFEQDIAWGISCDNDSLQIYVNDWITKNKNKTFFRTLYDKYYVNPRPAYQSDDNYSLEKGRISSFDPIIKKYAATIDWDWRLLASLIYQESHFIMQQVSSSGAIGLMQLMPDVAEKYNITLESSIEAQVSAGTRYLKYIEKQIPKEIEDEFERTLFVMAAYNSGLGHILDARRIAEQDGKDPNVWFGNVNEALMKKENTQIRRDSIIRHGYANATQIYNFVSDIVQRYHHYCNFVE